MIQYSVLVHDATGLSYFRRLRSKIYHGQRTTSLPTPGTPSKCVGTLPNSEMCSPGRKNTPDSVQLSSMYPSYGVVALELLALTV